MKTKLHLTLVMLLLTAVNAAATPARIFIEDFSIQAGESKQMLIDLENPNDNITLVEFDMFLPTGLSISSEEDAVDIAGRTTWKKHSLKTASKSGGTHFLLYSSSNALLTGTSGAIISVMLSADNNFSGGDIKLQNILLVTPQQDETKPSDYVYTIVGNLSEPRLVMTKLEFEGEQTKGKSVTIRPYIKNEGADYEGKFFRFTSMDPNDKGNPVSTINNATIPNGAEVNYAFSFTPAQAGTYYIWFATDNAAENIIGSGKLVIQDSSPSSNIIFADAEVKRICVQNWDTNGDGELSMNEAAAVTSMEKPGWPNESVFSWNREIETFDELKYFTGLTEIQVYAFSDCNFLKSISFPESVRTIQCFAFRNCYSLTNLHLPDRLTYLYDDAFENCDALTTVTIPKYVYAEENMRYCSGAFSDCNNLTEIKVVPENPFLESIDDVLYLKSHKNIYQYPAGKREQSYTILDGVGLLVGGTFSGCKNLTSIKIPESVKTINGSVFKDCTGLTELEIPQNVRFDGLGHILGCTNIKKIISHITEPEDLTEHAFDIEYFNEQNYTMTSATLYVPAGTKGLYLQKAVWKDFANIIEMGSGTSPNNGSSFLSISNVSGSIGNTFTLPISMINEDEITAMQFELSLPDGVSVAGATLTDRKNGHSIDFSQLANGNSQFTVFSSSSKAINDSEGDVANISLSISSSMAVGSYTIQVKNIELTTTAGDAINQADLSATLTVSNIKLGDVNGDDKITITDAVGIVNYILGNASSNFHAEAADVNSDGSISITDAVRVVNIILNQGSGVKERRLQEMETEREPQ